MPARTAFGLKAVSRFAAAFTGTPGPPSQNLLRPGLSEPCLPPRAPGRRTASGCLDRRVRQSRRLLRQAVEEIDSRKVVTLQEALDRGLARIDETGNVNALVVENISADSDLLLQSGDVIKGGRQDRMIAADTLVSPGSGKVSLAVHCVEAGRWVGRGGEAATHFAKSDGYAVGNDLKRANLTREQSTVWQSVKGNQDKLNEKLHTTVNSAASPTSFQLTLENPKVQANVAEYETALIKACENRTRVIGAVFAVNGKVTGAEVYGSSKLFQKAWPKLLRAAAVEAIAEQATAATPPSMQDVERFLVEAKEPKAATADNREHVVVQGLANVDGHPDLSMQMNDTPHPTPDGQSLGRGAVPDFRDSRSRRVTPLGDLVIPAPTQKGRVNTNCVENDGSLMYESRDSSKQNAVIHRPFIKK